MKLSPYEPIVMYWPAHKRRGPACCNTCAGGPCPTGGDDTVAGWAWTMGLILVAVVALPAILKK